MERTDRTVEELARELAETDFDSPGPAQPPIGFFRRRRFGL